MVITDPSAGVSGTIAHPPPQGTIRRCTHPVAGSQESVVQELPSPHSSVDPLLQAPAEHVSPVVQAFPSSHAFVFAACAQPFAGSQESVVHPLLSSQFVAEPPAHAPLAQVSPVVQALPSSQASALFVNTQPLSASHESVVQALLSLQTRGVPDRQAPSTQTSSVVQAFWSVQGSELFACSHPTARSQESVVHGLLSSQLNAAPG
jgi:hypothetical protein